MYRTDTAKSSKKPRPSLLAVQTTNELIGERAKKQTPKVDDDKPFLAASKTAPKSTQIVSPIIGFAKIWIQL